MHSSPIHPLYYHTHQVVHEGRQITEVSDAVRFLSVAGEVALRPVDDSHATRAAVLSALKVMD